MAMNLLLILATAGAMYTHSTTIEKERPELNEETKALISAYHRNPSEQNWQALERQVEKNYDKVVARKQAKLEELKRTAKTKDKIEEMEVIVEEMHRDRKNRIAQSMARFTDQRMRPGSRENQDGFHIVGGSNPPISIGHFLVTNAEYKKFNPKWPKDDNVPVVGVSYDDALKYCKWLGPNYRLPTEAEWELAAGHMPKDADFDTIEGACGGKGFWGNVWQWTSDNKVKGGSWKTPRTSCRTEYRSEVRDPHRGYEDVGFRVVRE